jgi:hypothetical protein
MSAPARCSEANDGKSAAGDGRGPLKIGGGAPTAGPKTTKSNREIDVRPEPATFRKPRAARSHARPPSACTRNPHRSYVGGYVRGRGERREAKWKDFTFCPKALALPGDECPWPRGPCGPPGGAPPAPRAVIEAAFSVIVARADTHGPTLCIVPYPNGLFAVASHAPSGRGAARGPGGPACEAPSTHVEVRPRSRGTPKPSRASGGFVEACGSLADGQRRLEASGGKPRPVSALGRRPAAGIPLIWGPCRVLVGLAGEPAVPRRKAPWGV